MDVARHQRRGRLTHQRRHLVADISGSRHQLRGGGMHRAIEIAAQRRDQGVGIDEAPLISRDAAIKAARHRLDPTSDTKVGDTHLAQTAIKIGEHRVEEGLREPGGFGMIATQPAQHEEGMERQQLETPVERVGDAKLGIEEGITRPLDNAPESVPDGAPPLAAA